MLASVSGKGDLADKEEETFKEYFNVSHVCLFESSSFGQITATTSQVVFS